MTLTGTDEDGFGNEIKGGNISGKLLEIKHKQTCPEG